LASATLVVAETNGPSATAVETLDPSNLNFGSDDSAEIVPASHPIVAMADGHSYEKWLRLYVSALGDSSVVDNVKVWLSDLGGGWQTGEGVSCNLVTTGYSAASYPTAGPVNTDSADATEAMPESEPGSANVGISGSLTGQITSAPAYTDWIVLQMDVTASTPAGAVNTKVLTFQWDEM